jgi:CHAT domain-containing protein
VRRRSPVWRAFFYAGAKSLVVSHWEVDSEATVALMRLSHAEAAL